MTANDIWRHLLAHSPSARVAYHHSPTSRWNYATIETGDPQLSYNHRAVLPHEVVLDLDAATEAENFATLKKLSRRLGELKIAHSVWQTGGPAGYHVHVFMAGLKNVSDNHLLKEIIFEWLTQGVEGKFDRQLLGNHLVRMEYGKYEKAYPKDAYKLPVIGLENHFKENVVPEELWAEYRSQVIARAVKRLVPKEARVHGKMPECMRFILSEEFKAHKDCRKRALWVIANYYHKLEDESLFDMLKTFSQYNLAIPLSDREIRGMMRKVKTHTGRRVGCFYRHSLLKELGKNDVVMECEQQ